MNRGISIRMDLLGRMATFVRVTESGSFSAAAKQLRISAAAVSRQIATLEAELHVTLLKRTTRRMALTEAGRRYYEQCLRVLREVDEAQSVGKGELLDGPLHVSAPVTFGLARVAPLMRGLMTKHPGLRIDLQLEDRLIDLVQDGADVAIRVGATPPESAELIAHRLYSFNRIVVASPSYLKRAGEPKTPEALVRLDALVGMGSPTADFWVLRSHDREARIRLNVIFRSNSLHVLRDLVAGGTGMTMVPQWFVTEELRRRELRAVLPGWESAPVQVYAIHRVEHRGSLRVRALIEHLRAAFAG